MVYSEVQSFFLGFVWGFLATQFTTCWTAGADFVSLLSHSHCINLNLYSFKFF